MRSPHVSSSLRSIVNRSVPEPLSWVSCEELRPTPAVHPESHWAAYEEGDMSSEGTGAEGDRLVRLSIERREFQRTLQDLQKKCEDWLVQLDGLLKESPARHSNFVCRPARKHSDGSDHTTLGGDRCTESPPLLPDTPFGVPATPLAAWRSRGTSDADVHAEKADARAAAAPTIRVPGTPSSESLQPQHMEARQLHANPPAPPMGTAWNIMLSPSARSARGPAVLMGRVASFTSGLGVGRVATMPWSNPLGARGLREWKRPRRTGSDAMIEEVASGRVFGFPTVKEQAMAARQAKKRVLYRLVESLPFQALSAFLLLANAIFMGASADSELAQQGAGVASDPKWLRGSVFFTVAFMVELILRFMAGPWLWVFGPDCSWNLMETLLVLHALACLAAQSYMSSMPLRLLRTARLFDCLSNIRGFHKLRMIMLGIKASIRSLTWILLIVVWIIYMFAVFFVWGVSQYYYRSEHTEAFPEMFGSVRRSSVTLFMCISAGIDWQEAMRELEVLPRIFQVVLIAYLCIMIYAVINVVIGTMVSDVADIAKHDKESMVIAEKLNDDRFSQKIWALFHEAEIDESGTISWASFQDHLNNEDVKAYFHALELDIPQAQQIFKMLDESRRGVVDLDEFVSACMHLKNQAKSLDIKLLMHQNDLTLKWLQDALESIRGRFGSLEAKAAAAPRPNHRRKTSDGPEAPVSSGNLLSVLPISE